MHLDLFFRAIVDLGHFFRNAVDSKSWLPLNERDMPCRITRLVKSVHAYAVHLRLSSMPDRAHVMYAIAQFAKRYTESLTRISPLFELKISR
jgi:hypothetical protein